MAEETRSPNLQPVAFVLVALLWFFTMTGGRQIFVNEVLSKAYDSQAEHFLRGDVGVDGDAIRHEIMIVDGKSRMYLGPFPAFLRIPLNHIYPGERGNWSRISGFCAALIALAAFAGLVRMALRASQLPSRWQNWLGNASLVGFALARRCCYFSEISPSMTKRSFGDSHGRWPPFILRCDLDKRKDLL